MLEEAQQGSTENGAVRRLPAKKGGKKMDGGMDWEGVDLGLTLLFCFVLFRFCWHALNLPRHLRLFFDAAAGHIRDHQGRRAGSTG